MTTRRPLSNVTNKVRAQVKRFTAFQQENDMPLKWNDETVDMNLDLSPIKSRSENYPPSRNVFQETVLISPKAIYPPKNEPFGVNYNRALENFPAIYSDENYIDQEVVNSYIDYCAGLKELSEQGQSISIQYNELKNSTDLSKASAESSTSYFKENILINCNDNSTDEILPPLKTNDVSLGKKLLKKIWVRKEKHSLPKTEIEDFL